MLQNQCNKILTQQLSGLRLTGCAILVSKGNECAIIANDIRVADDTPIEIPGRILGTQYLSTFLTLADRATAAFNIVLIIRRSGR